MYQHFAHYYNQIFIFDQKLTNDLLPFIKVGGKAIDLGCGTGRLVELLNHLQMHTVGIDIDQTMIEVAKRDYPNHQFYRDSMVDYLGRERESYDLMTCFGNTLPHLTGEELHIFLERAKSRLNHQGYFLVQLLNYDKILRNKPKQLKCITFDGGQFERHYVYHEHKITFTTVLMVGDQRTTEQTTLYPYRRDELVKHFNQAGFQCTVQKSLTETYDEKADHITLICQ